MNIREIKTLIGSGIPVIFDVLVLDDGWSVLVRWGKSGHSPLEVARGDVRIFRSVDPIFRLARELGIAEIRSAPFQQSLL